MVAATASPAESILSQIATASSTTQAAVTETTSLTKGISKAILQQAAATSKTQEDTSKTTSLIKAVSKDMDSTADATATTAKHPDAGMSAEEERAQDNKSEGLQELHQRETVKVFKSMAKTFENSIGELKGSLKQDFDLLTLQFAEVSSSPGVRSIIALLKFVGLILGKMLFTLIAGKFFKGLVKMNDDNSMDIKETWKNMKKWANPFEKSGLTRKGPKIGKDGVGPPKPADMDPYADMYSKSEIMKMNAKASLADMQAQVGKKFDSIKKGVSSFFGMEAFDMSSLIAETKKGSKEQQERWKASMTQAFLPMTEGWAKMKKSASDKFAGMKKSIGEKFTSITGAVKNSVQDVSKNAMKMAKDSKAGQMLAKASAFMRATMKNMGKVLMKAAKRFIVPIATFIMSSLAFIASMIAAAAAMILPAVPIILIILAIVLLAVGLVMLGKFIAKNWETIKEKFSIAMEQLSIWAAKAGLWLSNSLAPMRDKIAMFFAKIMDGIANMVNGAIGYINSMQPRWLKKITGGDLIDWRMDADNAEKAKASAEVRANNRSKEAEGIALREKNLADRKAALTGDQAVAKSGDSNTAVTTVNNNNQKKVIQVVDTTPNDRYAGMMAVAQ
jgi:hypothetical protein